MAIVQAKSVVKTRENGSTYFEDRWYAKCDQCKNICDKQATEAGDADYHARRAGFHTVNLGLGKALRWVCGTCAKRLAKKVVG